MNCGMDLFLVFFSFYNCNLVLTDKVNEIDKMIQNKPDNWFPN